MERQVPLCSKCDTRHWNIWSCEEAERKNRPVQIQWRGAPMGHKPVGDRLQTLTRSGETLFRRRGA